MIRRENIRPKGRWLQWMMAGALAIIAIVCTHAGRAQQMPPRPMNIYVSPTQNLGFGAFFQGAGGGTITVAHDGTRSTTGSVIAAGFGFPYSAALFELDAEPGTIISILNGSSVNLAGSNGGFMQLTVGAASTGPSFVSSAVPPARTMISVGGTLSVGNVLASPPGDYSGTFEVIFFQQ